MIQNQNYEIKEIYQDTYPYAGIPVHFPFADTKVVFRKGSMIFTKPVQKLD